MLIFSNICYFFLLVCEADVLLVVSDALDVVVSEDDELASFFVVFVADVELLDVVSSSFSSVSCFFFFGFVSDAVSAVLLELYRELVFYICS